MLANELQAAHKMNIDEFNRLLLETVGVGLIIASYPELNVIYRNNRVLEWFPSFEERSAVISDKLVGVEWETGDWNVFYYDRLKNVFE